MSEQYERAVSKIKQKRRKGHAILNHARIVKAFGLKMSDLPDAIAYLKTLLVDNALQLPLDLTKRQIQLLGVGACAEDRPGFSFGDLALWIQQNPNPAVTHEEFNRMVLKVPLSQRTFYNYKNLSKSYAPENRHPTLSRAHHDVVRTVKDRREQRRLLDLAFDRGWTVPEFKLHYKGAGKRSPHARQQECEISEKASKRSERVAFWLRKPGRTIEDTAKAVSEINTLIREYSELKELVVHGPPPSD